MAERDDIIIRPDERLQLGHDIWTRKGNDDVLVNVL